MLNVSFVARDPHRTSRYQACLIFGVLRDTYDEGTFTFYRFASIQCRCLVAIQLDRYLTEAGIYKQLAQLSVGIKAESMLREGVPRHLFRSPCDEEEIATGPQNSADFSKAANRFGPKVNGIDR